MWFGVHARVVSYEVARREVSFSHAAECGAPHLEPLLALLDTALDDDDTLGLAAAFGVFCVARACVG